MESKQYLEAGKIVNTHGTRGEVKIQPWADSAEFLQGFDTLYLSEDRPMRLLSSRVHKGCLIAVFEGVDHIDAAIPLKNKVVYIRRDDAQLPPGHFFVQDILGLPVIDDDDAQIGRLKEVLPLPGGDVYVIVGGDGEHLVPDVPEFIPEKNLDEGFIRVRLIEGM